ncbi:four helix bundle protein [Candidatus Kaiserbacteria bacterium]|nr:four helix bundle protein [Candidatus Kaiserbacteria bacterium]
MNQKRANKYRDLEERTFQCAKRCRDFVKRLPRTISNIEYGKQLIRSSASQAANYIEANESLSKKDFAFRIKICRKEAKESDLWLNLCDVGSKDIENEREYLIGEVGELRRIFSSILDKTK